MKNPPALALLITCLLTSAHGQILLQDDFNGPTVNSNLWEVILPFPQSQVTQTGGLLTTTERGVVATVAGFDVPIEITGRLTLHKASENFAIRLRTDLSRSGFYSQFYEITGARVIFSAGNNRLYIDELGPTNDGYPRLAEVPFAFVIGRSYDFRIIDTKTNLTVFIDGVNVASAATAFATGNRVEFDGRIFSGESTSLDFIQIAQVAPAPAEALMYVGNYDGTIRKFNLAGDDLGYFATNGFDLPHGVAVDEGGNVYVASVANNNVRRFSPSGADLGVFASTGISDPRALAFDAGGNLYIGNAGNPYVRRYSAAGVDLGNFATNSGSGNTGIAFDANGNVYVANYFDNTVRKFSPGGADLGLIITTGLSQPIGIGINSQGDIYVACDFASKLVHYNAMGTFVTNLTSGSLGRLIGVAIDAADNVYVVRATGNAVRKFSSSGQDLGDIVTTGLNGPGFLAISQYSPLPPHSLQVLSGPVTNNANDHVYYLLSSSSWTDAEAKAVELGGHLVTLNDATEQAWVYNTFATHGGISRQLWIGLNDAAQEGIFVWASGEPVTYLNWYPGEPNNYGLGEDYGMIFQPQDSRGGYWNDADNIASIDSTGLQGTLIYGVVELPRTNATCVPPDGLVSWWPGEGTAQDLLGANHGIVEGAVAFEAGKVGHAFRFNSTNADVKIPASASLDVGLGGGFTLEAWVYPTNVSVYGPVFEWNTGTNSYWGVHLYTSVEGSGTLYASLENTGGPGAGFTLKSAPGVIGADVYQHVAMTYDRTEGMVKLYRNGLMVAQRAVGNVTAQTSYPLYLGRRPPSLGEAFTFPGLIDEPAVYNRALSTNEITAIYNAGSGGKCQLPPTVPAITHQPQSLTVAGGAGASFSVTATGTDPLHYQWFKDGLKLPTGTNATLNLLNVQPPQIGDYSVVVANLSGSVTSAVASLDISNVNPALWRGLVGYYPLNGNPMDVSGWENNGTNILSSYAGDRFNQATNALAVNGGTSGVLVNGSPSLDVYRAFTLSAWIFTTNNWNDGGYRAFLAKDMDHYTPGVQFLFRLGPDKRYILWVGNGSTFKEFASVSKYDLGQWRHVSATFDSDAGKVMLYVDGKLDASYTTSQKCFSAVGLPLRIGRQYTTVYGSQQFSFVGRVDDVRIYNRALASNEVTEVFSSEVPPPVVLAITPPGALLNEGADVTFTATAAGQPPLTYQWQFNGGDLTDATNAVLSLSNVTYAQAGNYAVVVTGPGGTASSNAVLTVNRLPLADAGATQTLLISPNGSNAVAVLNGSLSSDPDGDALTYEWFRPGEASAFASGVVAVTALPVGLNPLTLVVHDGMGARSQDFTVEVITTSAAVDRLVELAQSGAGNPQPLIATLRAALASIDRSQPAVAINQLEAFKNKVLAQVMPVDPELAALLLADAQTIIDALNGGPAAEVPLEITGIERGQGGKPKLSIRGRNNRTLVVEASANMVDWTPVGVAAPCGDCGYEYEDAQVNSAGARFYRVVSPK